MFRNSLQLKVSLYLILALSPAMIVLPFYIVRHQQEHLQEEIARHVTQVAEIIVKSTRYAMLINQREMAEKIIEDVGRQAGIERVRVLTKDGTIIHSNRRSETGYSVEQQSEPCVRCHLTSKPLQKVPDDQRWRIYTDPTGKRLLSAMEPIRNELTCSTASCHEHPAGQSVLGVVDIAYSLDEIDATLRTHAMYILGISLAVVLAVAISVAVLLRRLIYRPLTDLNTGARLLAAGELDHQIPVRSDDEFGRVAQSFNDMSGTLQGTMAELQDLVQTLEDKVTERTEALQRAQAEVAQGEKLAAVGQLASGIAHELNNPLTGVLTFTSLLRKKMPEGSLDAEDLDLVIRETRRCASIIRRLLDFARVKVPSNGLFDLNQVVEETVRFTDWQATLQSIEIDTELDPALPKIWGDADLIKQVVLNIVVNATQAITGQGRIVVATRQVASSGPAAEPMVELSIQDNGCGIPEANLQRIFDPFFTTKEVGKGTGLGLSVSYGIVRAHHGTIQVASTLGEGTTFRIRLPIQAPTEGVESTEGKVTT
ncbi:MAG: HAMP domain-containing protein [Ideonella sp.]|nr:HAMP domain-containing protein [Ideonella sp.]